MSGGDDPKDDVHAHGDAVTLNYTKRFGCIGPDCEDHCCYFWRVDIDKNTYEKMKYASQFAPQATRERYKKAIRVHKPKKKKELPRYTMRMVEGSANCAMLEPNGLCHIHAVFGEKFLSDTCALYPRKFTHVAGRVEVSAVASCPESCRKLLLAEDATEEVSFDLKVLGRPVPKTHLDLRDIRPYYRSMLEIRDFVIRNILRDKEQTVRQRLFNMIWFAKRTSGILREDNYDQDTAAVDKEKAMMASPAVRGEIAKRFAKLETPSALVMILARQLVRPNIPKTHMRPKFNRLISGVFGTYDDLGKLVGLTEEETRKAKYAGSLEGVWKEYTTRRDLTLKRAQARVDQYLVNYAVYYWYNRHVSEAPNLMTFLLRLVAEMACQKFLLFSHPKVLAAIRAGDAMDDATFQTQLDEAAVESFYNVSRFMEHGTIITSLEKALEGRQLNSLAGAVYLLKF